MSSLQGLSLVMPVRNRVGTIEATLKPWIAQLNSSKLGRESELIIVDDASTDETASLAEKLPVKLIRNTGKQGFGSCIRLGLAAAQYPIFGYVGTDYPYTASDLPKLLEKYGEYNEDVKLKVDLVNGCRTGISTPPVWKTLGLAKRIFYKVVLGNPMSPFPGWYGVREHSLNSWTKFVYGNPFHDVNCAFKLFNKSRLEKIPIQSDDDGVHIELISKMTFLTTLMDEVTLTPKIAPIPETTRKHFNEIFRKPQFVKEPMIMPSNQTISTQEIENNTTQTSEKNSSSHVASQATHPPETKH